MTAHQRGGVKRIDDIRVRAGTFGPFFVRAFLLALPLVLAACRPERVRRFGVLDLAPHLGNIDPCDLLSLTW